MVGERFDVVVVGSGIAGVSAALEAAGAGARVALASLGATFSGSSFYGGTWGLGLVGPRDEHDIDDLVKTILQVGCGQAEAVLAQTLVEGIDPAIGWLESQGITLRRPIDANQREYIPCFDHTTRSWHGLVRSSLRQVWERELDRLGVIRLPQTELMDLEERDGRVSAALLADHAGRRLLQVPCGAVVLATGGLAGLYERCLTAADTCGSAHGIALAHGCSLVNAEFLQMMPGTVAPVRGVVLNEKAFRYATLPFSSELLSERSGYGPFTTRLASHAIDLAMAAAGPEGLALSYRLPSDPPELVADYFAWLATSFGLRPTDELRVSLFAHASNGGIRIAPDASCAGGPTGLFACGECTGGMHGADRLGGLASASALVFGRIAGTQAARAAGRGHEPTSIFDAPLSASAHQGALLHELRATMSAHAMTGRTQAGLSLALRQLDAVRERLRDTSAPTTDVAQAAPTTRLTWQLAAARALLHAMRKRTASCGSHHRSDDPGR